MATRRTTAARLILSVSAVALTLSACNKPAPTPTQQTVSADGQPITAPPIAALPLATAAPPAPPVAAPPAAALPASAHAIRVAPTSRADRYRYTDRALAMGQAFGDTPPDYTVGYQGTRPWVWRADNGGYRVVEQLPQGQRDYYYQPGADAPFYVSDPDGGYAYEGGDLVGVYGPDGTPRNDAYARERADTADRYLDRARALYQAARYQQRQSAYAADWQARRNEVIDRQRAWDAARSRDAEWQAWHDADEQEQRQAWHAERDRRVAYAAAIGVGLGVGAAVVSHEHDRGTYDQGPPPLGGRPGYFGPPLPQPRYSASNPSAGDRPVPALRKQQPADAAAIANQRIVTQVAQSARARAQADANARRDAARAQTAAREQAVVRAQAAQRDAAARAHSAAEAQVAIRTQAAARQKAAETAKVQQHAASAANRQQEAARGVAKEQVQAARTQAQATQRQGAAERQKQAISARTAEAAQHRADAAARTRADAAARSQRAETEHASLIQAHATAASQRQQSLAEHQKQDAAHKTSDQAQHQAEVAQQEGAQAAARMQRQQTKATEQIARAAEHAKRRDDKPHSANKDKATN